MLWFDLVCVTLVLFDYHASVSVDQIMQLPEFLSVLTLLAALRYIEHYIKIDDMRTNWLGMIQKIKSNIKDR